MPRSEHGIQGPDIIAAMDAGDQQTAKSLASAKLTSLAIAPWLWIAGIAAVALLLIKAKK